jgi:anti-sigma regulatory factor (Ser/Thr protein kinase)
MNDRTTASGGGTGDGTRAGTGPAFRHELYPYQGQAQFLDGALAFVEDARGRGELVLVAVGEGKERELRARLTGTPAGQCVSFLDTAALGRNPGRLIPAWQHWIGAHVAAGRPVRGIGEFEWNGGSPVEAAELRYHEWLLNVAFARSAAWWLLCPYDLAVVQPALVSSARRCHPLVYAEGAHGPSGDYCDQPFEFDALAAPCDPHQALPYGHGDLGAVRAKVTACAAEHGVEGTRLRELLIAATEVAANSISHGGGTGTLRTWAADGMFTCEFHDAGHISDPLVGRVRPSPTQIGGRGMWLVHQLCDLVQIRSTADEGTTVRLHTVIR